MPTVPSMIFNHLAIYHFKNPSISWSLKRKHSKPGGGLKPGGGSMKAWTCSLMDNTSGRWGGCFKWTNHGVKKKPYKQKPTFFRTQPHPLIPKKLLTNKIVVLKVSKKGCKSTCVLVMDGNCFFNHVSPIPFYDAYFPLISWAISGWTCTQIREV